MMHTAETTSSTKKTAKTNKATGRRWIEDPDLLRTGRKPRKVEVRGGQPTEEAGGWTARVVAPQDFPRPIPASWHEAAIGFSRWCGRVSRSGRHGHAFVEAIGPVPVTEVVTAFLVGLDAWQAVGSPKKGELTASVRALADAIHVADNPAFPSPAVVERVRKAAAGDGPHAQASREALALLATDRLAEAELNIKELSEAVARLLLAVEEGLGRFAGKVGNDAQRFDRVRADLATARAAIVGPKA